MNNYNKNHKKSANRYLGLQLGLVKSSEFNLRDLASNASDNLKKFYDKSLDYGGQLTEQIKKRLPANLDDNQRSMIARALIGGSLGGLGSFALSGDDLGETAGQRRMRLLRNTVLGTVAGAGVAGLASPSNGAWIKQKGGEYFNKAKDSINSGLESTKDKLEKAKSKK